MNSDFLFGTLKGLGAAGVAVATVVTGYVNLSRDIKEVQTVTEKHDIYIEKDKEISVRVDERTVAIKEQLDRIERKIAGK
jgi:Na+-driven multidrug efflux pump